MELNDIKKALYRGEYDARIINVRKDGILYETYDKEGNTFSFLVPLNELGEVIWERLMPAKLLIRYLIVNEVS